MTIRDLVSRNKTRRNLPARREEDHPFFSLQRQMNDLFDSFFRDFDVAPLREFGDWYGDFSPSIDIKESSKEITVHAELPGMDEKDIEVLLAGNTLTLKGEKKEEKEEKSESSWHVERRYGSFSRVIPLSEEVDVEKVKATFKKGVLQIRLPKTKEAIVEGKKISIKTE